MNESAKSNYLFLGTKDDDLIICRRNLKALKLDKDMINELDDSRNSIHYSDSSEQTFTSPERAKYASNKKNMYSTPQQKLMSDRDIENMRTPKSYNLNLCELENAIKSYPLNLEIVKITKNIHGLNDDKLLFIELSPEEETYFTAGYCTLIQWSTKS